jgi:hypothetical protein
VSFPTGSLRTLIFVLSKYSPRCENIQVFSYVNISRHLGIFKSLGFTICHIV